MIHRYSDVVTWVGVLWHLIGILAEAGPSGVLTSSGAIVGLLVIAVFASRALPGAIVASVDPLAVPQGLRELARRTGIPRHRDPNASGRSRPRAPTTAPAAA